MTVVGGDSDAAPWGYETLLKIRIGDVPLLGVSLSELCVGWAAGMAAGEVPECDVESDDVFVA